MSPETFTVKSGPVTLKDGNSISLHRFAVPSGKELNLWKAGVSDLAGKTHTVAGHPINTLELWEAGISKLDGTTDTGLEIEIYDHTDGVSLYSTTSDYVQGNPIGSWSITGNSVEARINNNTGGIVDCHGFMTLVGDNGERWTLKSGPVTLQDGNSISLHRLLVGRVLGLKIVNRTTGDTLYTSPSNYVQGNPIDTWSVGGDEVEVLLDNGTIQLLDCHGFATLTVEAAVPSNTIHIEKATGKLTLNTVYTPLRHDPSNGEIGTSTNLPNYLILDPSTGEINSQAV